MTISDQPKVVGSTTFVPDPSIVHAVGRSHSFPSAVADIIDNSIDAGATRVKVRFLRRDNVVIGLRIIDNGKGMDGATFEQAMQYARKRTYDGNTDLGHFGIGLKAASMSQADQLIVYSRMYGATPAGRMIERKDPNKVYALDADDVAAVLAAANPGFPIDHGTIVQWTKPRKFLVDASTEHREQWFSTTSRELITHLGIHFHRILARDRVTIAVDEWDLGLEDGSVPVRVTPLDPFAFQDSGGGVRADFAFRIDGGARSSVAVIWPPEQSVQPGYILAGGGIRNQGFFVYRHDRLISMGGWHDLAHESDQLAFARIAIDLDEDLERHITLNPEKAGVELDAALREALKGSEIGDRRLTLSQFIDTAKGAYKESRKYAKQPTRIARPDRGFSGETKRALEANMAELGDLASFTPGGPVDVRWRASTSDGLIDVDHDNRTIWLNSKYRSAVTGSQANDNDDAPLLKALLLILYGPHFDGAYFGAKEKRDHAVWQHFLLAALDDQIRTYEVRKQGDSQ